jgi:hypothetical protein
MAPRLSALHADHFSPPGKFLVLISVRCCVDPRAMVWLEGLGKLKISTSSRTWTSNLLACSIVPQPTMLPHVRVWIYIQSNLQWILLPSSAFCLFGSLQSRTWRWHVHKKCWLTFNNLCSVTSHIELFTTTAVRTSTTTQCILITLFYWGWGELSS